MAPAMRQHGVLITISVMVASIMQSLDTTIANVALPRIQGSLSSTQDQITWVLTSYIIATAIMMPLSGWLAGQFGRKRIFLISIALFTFASVLCGLAQTLPEMVLFRTLQGLGGAALVPMSQGRCCSTSIRPSGTDAPWRLGGWESYWARSSAPRSADR